MALDRVIAEQRQGGTYPFVPIIADDPGDLAHLPPFAQQYQGVRLADDGRGLADLVRVAARLDAAQPVRLVAQPFMGLEAFEAKDAALFFGRRKETQDLVDRLRTTNLVLVTGDSGSGKSSLVKAGLIPAFREGALADPLGRRPEPGQWHVVEMRPGTDPFEGLVEGAQRAATAAGIAPEMIFALGTAIRTRDPGTIRDALRQSGPPGASLLPGRRACGIQLAPHRKFQESVAVALGAGIRRRQHGRARGSRAGTAATDRDAASARSDTQSTDLGGRAGGGPAAARGGRGNLAMA